MTKLRVLDLFAGIGGFSLGLERAGGFETVAFCEIDPFCRRVLAKHWPEVPQYHDVRELTADTLARDGIAVDVITGGFPCQDISTAGKQAGIGEGTRSGLWSEIVRLTRDLRPKYLIVENVANLLSGPSEKRGGWFGRILGDLAECGYDAEWENIPAAALGAPHRRERVWIVAYRSSFVGNVGELGEGEGEGEIFQPTRGGRSIFSHPDCERRRRRHPELSDAENAWEQPSGERGNPRGMGAWDSEPDVGRVANGVPGRVDRLKALGNAVIPQIPEMIGRAIMDAAE